MVLDLVFDGFSCISMVYIIQNPKIPDILGIFGNITWKRAIFCQKWVPKLKIAISQKHIFVNNLRKKHARKLKFGKVMEKKWLKKLVQFRFLNFDLILKKMDYVGFKIDSEAYITHFFQNGTKTKKSELYKFFQSFFPITWPNFSFLACFF